MLSQGRNLEFKLILTEMTLLSDIFELMFTIHNTYACIFTKRRQFVDILEQRGNELLIKL